MKDVEWAVAGQPWQADGVGNHRAVLQVHRAADLCVVTVPWRRRDREPQKMGVRLFETAGGEEVTNLAPLKVSRELGQFAFQAKREGLYALYYMPFTTPGPSHDPNNVEYRAADYSKAEAAWLARNGIALEAAQAGPAREAAQAQVVRIESRSEFDRFDPMEVVATTEEMDRLLAAHRGRPYLVFPEDRCRPVRMTEYLPLRWIAQGPSDKFAGQAQPNEYYAFQLAVYALGPIDDLKILAGDLRNEEGKTLPAAAVTCFNLQGVDWLGRPFTKKVSVGSGKVQALWFGVDLPADASGTYRGSITVMPDSPQTVTVSVSLEVAGPALADRGDSELWRHSRIRWLNSTIGIDDEPTAQYPPLEVQGQTVRCLGRRVRFGADALPQSIQSFFVPTGDRIGNEPVDILHQPIRVCAQVAGKAVQWKEGGLTIDRIGAGRVRVQSRREAGPLALHCRADMEFDGHIEYFLTFKASEDVALDDVRLQIGLRREIATYMMGFGCKGGYRPKEWRYRWDINFTNNMVWIGQANAGLQCKLKHAEDVWALLNYRDEYGLPQNWANDGKGGCDVTECDEGSVLLDAFTGPRVLKAGQSLVLRFALLITPTKPVDTDAHWAQRYYHGCDMTKVRSFVSEAVAGKASVVNVHHGNVLLPHINYPFLHVDELKRYVKDGHDKGLKVKFYYTIRELSNFTAEIWMLRSLGDEIYQRGTGHPRLADLPGVKTVHVGMGTGHAWLCEHLVEGYSPAWHQPLADGQVDAAVITAGLSRWHNYYLEGLRWLVREVGIDGIYLDGIGYDREIMKRVRKVLDRAKSGCLVDFHAGNNFTFWVGMNNAANQNMEHFPFLDSLWFGEFFNYDDPPEYWLVEMSGIPLGQMNEMLEGGGNPWRGMTMGMSTRLGYIKSDPRAIWKFWDDFGLTGSQMIGFWLADCPVRTDHPEVMATAYVKPGRTIVSVASWAQQDVTCRLKIDWKALGMDGQKVRVLAPEIEGFQEALDVAPDDALLLPQGKGRLLVIEPR